MPSSKSCFSSIPEGIAAFCGSSALNCNPQSFFFFPAFRKIQSYLLLFKFVYLRSKKNCFVFCQMVHIDLKCDFVYGEGYLLLLALSNMNFIYVLNYSICNLFHVLFSGVKQLTTYFFLVICRHQGPSAHFCCVHKLSKNIAYCLHRRPLSSKSYLCKHILAAIKFSWFDQSSVTQKYLLQYIL